MKRLLMMALMAIACPASAQLSTLDPPATPEEMKMIRTANAQLTKGGGVPMTDQQAAEFIRNFRSKRLQLMSGAMAVQQAGSALRGMPVADNVAGFPPGDAIAPTTSIPTLDKATLKQQVAEQNKSATYTRFMRRGDGFSVNGQPQMDVEGQITNFGANNQTGEVSYTVLIAPNHARLKYRNVNSGLPPILVADIIQQGPMVSVKTISEESLGGTGLIPTSRGAVLQRAGGMVIYDLEKGAQAIALPEGFEVATYQNGDVAGTGFMLLERIPALEEADTDNPINRLKNADRSLKSIGNSLGIGRDETHDYLLFNPSSGRLVPLNVAARNKNVLQMSNCRRQNDIVNKCANARSIESAYNPDGSPNTRHYYWAIRWLNTVHGPMAAAYELNGPQVSLIELNSGNRYTVFKRRMGIAEWDIQPTANGSARITAGWSFKQHVVEDIAAVLDGSHGAEQGRDSL